MNNNIYSAYLIIICDTKTNAILDVNIWSSPEWEQSRRLKHPTYIAYQVDDCSSFQEAKTELLSRLNMPGYERYKRLLDFCKDVKNI